MMASAAPWEARKVAAWHAARARTHAGEGFIYLAELAGTDVIKIGHSLNPEQRAKKVEHCGFNAKPRLIAKVLGSWVQEKALHRALRDEDAAMGHEYYRRSILSHPAIPQELREAA